jgi:mannose-6-phosphate isomerase-like protein (cupin superfamily)
MSYKLNLSPEYGTKLYLNGDNIQEISVHTPQKGKEKFAPFDDMLVIVGETITRLSQLSIRTLDGMKCTVPPKTAYMIMNTAKVDAIIELTEDPTPQKIIYDPYLYEKEKHVDYNPNEFKKKHPVPNGYVDTLTKWYSIKFTYPEYNLIFVRPKLGISIQAHKMREEHWEILEGLPIIIAGNKVNYEVKKGTKFSIPFYALHTVINPTDNWILLKESYGGTFDEQDIIRVFNPNHFK